MHTGSSLFWAAFEYYGQNKQKTGHIAKRAT